ncbi:protein ELYS isoform X2 [Cylas formicarius]|uniref:protein ELYS isoform X2 n=1 Tax=Cylas formicarius TaxID=197179 RepID=UPI002958D459|nr:protein ELYS isoform X2 [Cylas formicarius]
MARKRGTFRDPKRIAWQESRCLDFRRPSERSGPQNRRCRRNQAVQRQVTVSPGGSPLSREWGDPMRISRVRFESCSRHHHWTTETMVIADRVPALLFSQITSAYVIDAGRENTLLPTSSPLRYFDGIAVVGTLGGDVYLLDICRQICEGALYSGETKAESNPAGMFILPKNRSGSVKDYLKESLAAGDHLAINLNEVHTSKGHFALKGEKGEDRVHVNKSETEVSATYYSPQIACLVVGYNFGAFQLWDLEVMGLVYTSPVCEELIPVTGFALQEPSDDPKAYCYLWVSYGQGAACRAGFPYAVMYSLHYGAKSGVDGHAHMYQNFQHCSLRFEIELGGASGTELKRHIRGGSCLGLQTVSKRFVHRSTHTISLCLVSWTLWDAGDKAETHALIFDLDQWYKEQMPSAPDWSRCSVYVLARRCADYPLLDVKLNVKSLVQFVGVQNLEEHFFPTALSFDLVGVGVGGATKLRSRCAQAAFADDLVADAHLSLVRPRNYYERALALGLAPLFCDVSVSSSNDTESQRDVLLSVALEQKLVGWLCACATKLANAAFHASGLTIDGLMRWAFRRAASLKASCDAYFTCLFDHSGTRLDDHALMIISHAACQIGDLVALNEHVADRLLGFVGEREAILEGRRCLKNLAVYFDLVLWMVNVGLLPEGPATRHRILELTRWYDEKRAQRRQLSDGTVELFIDNLVDKHSETVGERWREDGGTGSYPPPSLQSVLGVYLADGIELCFKHSLVMYALLDVSATADSRDATLLFRFPQIFGLDQSVAKIVEAFWHLDHDNYQTAVKYITAPCVSSDDLHHWHHTLMMRSLLLHEQHELALLYFRVAKPPVTDHVDVATVLSLLISKNMVHEAFEFERRHRGRDDDDALMMHIFNECNKRQLLHNVLYRSLSVDEERAFLKYVNTTAAGPRCADLRVCYYLLRSRFLEAFDAYDTSKMKKSEAVGLVGRRQANPMEDVVKMFKDQLPRVNRDLVDTARRENLYRQDDRPTPMSVFVHNPAERARYKSSFILAAMSKAKWMSDDDGTGTEGTPFLRTPIAAARKAEPSTPLVDTRVIDEAEQDVEMEAIPPKRSRLTPRASTSTPAKTPAGRISVHSLLRMSVVRRKSTADGDDVGHRAETVPHGILKATSTDDTARTPRTPLARTPLKGHVKFNDMRYPSPVAEAELQREEAGVKLRREEAEAELRREEAEAELRREEAEAELRREKPKATVTSQSLSTKDITDVQRPVAQSPKARRSYKRSFSDNGPVRSSPRLSASSRNAEQTPIRKPNSRKSILTQRPFDLFNREPPDAAADDLSRPSGRREQISNEPGNFSKSGETSIDTSPLGATFADKDGSLLQCSGSLAKDGNSEKPEVVQRTPVAKSLFRAVLERNTFKQTSLAYCSSADTTTESDADYAETDESLRELLEHFGEGEKLTSASVVNDVAQDLDTRDDDMTSVQGELKGVAAHDKPSSGDKDGDSEKPEVVQRTPVAKSLVRAVLERNTFKQTSLAYCSSADTTTESDSDYAETDESLRELLEHFGEGQKLTSASGVNDVAQDLYTRDDDKPSGCDDNHDAKVEEQVADGGEDVPDDHRKASKESEGVAVYDDVSSCDGDVDRDPEEEIQDAAGGVAVGEVRLDHDQTSKEENSVYEYVYDDLSSCDDVPESERAFIGSSVSTIPSLVDTDSSIESVDNDEHMDRLVVQDDEDHENGSEEAKEQGFRSLRTKNGEGDDESPEEHAKTPEGPPEQEEQRLSPSGQGKKENKSSDGFEAEAHEELPGGSTEGGERELHEAHAVVQEEKDGPRPRKGKNDDKSSKAKLPRRKTKSDRRAGEEKRKEEEKASDALGAETEGHKDSPLNRTLTLRPVRRKYSGAINRTPKLKVEQVRKTYNRRQTSARNETTHISERCGEHEPHKGQASEEKDSSSSVQAKEEAKLRSFKGSKEEKAPDALGVEVEGREDSLSDRTLPLGPARRACNRQKKMEGDEDTSVTETQTASQDPVIISQLTEDRTFTPKCGKKRGRSASVEQQAAAMPMPSRLRSLRSKSVDTNVGYASTSAETLTPIEEGGGGYATTRRLTRSQAEMFKARDEASGVTAFDVDITGGRGGARAASESRFIASSATKMKTRLRSASVDAEPTPRTPKRSRKEVENETASIMTRSRTRSVSSTRSDTSQKSTASSSSRTVRSRRKPSALSGIREEETK